MADQEEPDAGINWTQAIENLREIQFDTTSDLAGKPVFDNGKSTSALDVLNTLAERFKRAAVAKAKSARALREQSDAFKASVDKIDKAMAAASKFANDASAAQSGALKKLQEDFDGMKDKYKQQYDSDLAAATQPLDVHIKELVSELAQVRNDNDVNRKAAETKFDGDMKDERQKHSQELINLKSDLTKQLSTATGAYTKDVAQFSATINTVSTVTTDSADKLTTAAKDLSNLTTDSTNKLNAVVKELSDLRTDSADKLTAATEELSTLKNDYFDTLNQATKQYGEDVSQFSKATTEYAATATKLAVMECDIETSKAEAAQAHVDETEAYVSNIKTATDQRNEAMTKIHDLEAQENSRETELRNAKNEVCYGIRSSQRRPSPLTHRSNRPRPSALSSKPRSRRQQTSNPPTTALTPRTSS